MMFGSYRKDEAQNPEIYSASIAATFELYPKEVIDFVSDPRTGIASEIKWLPNVAEVREFCNAAAARMAVLAQPRIVFKRHELPPKPPGDLFVGIDRPRYAEMSDPLDKHPEDGRRDNGGIWIPHHWYERRGAVADDEAGRITAARKHFERECRAEGIDPAGGVSPSLLRIEGERNARD